MFKNKKYLYICISYFTKYISQNLIKLHHKYANFNNINHECLCEFMANAKTTLVVNIILTLIMYNCMLVQNKHYELFYNFNLNKKLLF